MEMWRVEILDLPKIYQNFIEIDIAKYKTAIQLEQKQNLLLHYLL